MRNYPQKSAFVTICDKAFLPFYASFFDIIREKRVSIRFHTFFRFKCSINVNKVTHKKFVVYKLVGLHFCHFLLLFLV